MIDTVRLSIDLSPDEYQQVLPNIRLLRSSASSYQAHSTYTSRRVTGEYSPRLTLHHFRGSRYLLLIEVSLPKLIYGNNIDELSDSQFDEVVRLICHRIYNMTDFRLAADRLSEARVSALHLSKNIIFSDYTSCSSLVSALAKLDIHGRYDIQKTDFRPGHALHIHSGSQDVVFYDKISDMERSKLGAHRSKGSESRSLSVAADLSALTKVRPLDIFRYEMRLANRRKIKMTLPEYAPWDFQTLFQARISKQLLGSYWRDLIKGADFLGMSRGGDNAYTELIDYIQSNPDVKIRDAMTALTLMRIVHEAGYRECKQLVERIAGRHMWQRMKPLIRPPNNTTHKSFEVVSRQLSAFEAVRLNNIDKL